MLIMLFQCLMVITQHRVLESTSIVKEWSIIISVVVGWNVEHNSSEKYAKGGDCNPS